MAADLPTGGQSSQPEAGEKKDATVKTGLARMLKGGVIMDVINAEQVRMQIRRDIYGWIAHEVIF